MCPDPIELDALARGDLGERDRARVLEHLDTCSSCAGVVAELARMRSDVLSSPSVAFAYGETVLASRPPSTPPAAFAGAMVGRYQIKRRLGSGGMGTVLEAYDPELAREVAIKVLHPDPDGDLEVVRAMLLREAQAMARLNHPNVVTVFDVGTTGNQVFLAMELVQGTTLAEWLRAKRSRAEIVDAFVQAGRGLVAAHAAGLVHRDFKPANVLVGGDGRVRVSDFGLARNPARRALPGSGALETQTGVIIGTPSYMSPEQWRGQEADARSDQWSFGVALFEALVGRHPYPRETPEALRTAVLSTTRVAAPDDLPRSLRSLLERALAPRPDDRYRSMEALLGDLDRRRAPLVRRLLPGAALLLGAGAFAGAVVVAWPRGGEKAKAPPTACAKAADKLDDVWSASAHERLAEKLTAKSPLLEDLDRYAKDWRTMRLDVCEAALRKELSEELRDRRDACLDRHLFALDAAVKVLAKGASDPSAVVRGLPLVADCADASRVESSIFLPGDPEERKKLEAIEADLEEARAYTNANQLADAEPVGLRALEAATALGFDPILAEAEYRRASLLERRDDYPAAEKAYKDAFATARAGRDDEVMRASAIALVRVIGSEEERPADADEWIKTARAEVKRAETDAGSKAVLLQNEAGIDLTAGRYEDAKTKLREVVQIREASLDPDDSDIGIAHSNLGTALEKLGEYDAALLERKKALEVMKVAFGEDTPMSATYARGVADIQYQLGKYDEAREIYEKALETYARFADVESEVSTTHEELARVLRALKKPGLAVDEMRQSIAIREKLVGPEHPFVAGELKNLSDALADAGRSEEALAALDRASAIMAKAYGDDSPEGADIACARADLMSDLGRRDEAIALYEKAIGDVSRAYGPTSAKIGRYAFNLGLARKKKGDYAGAVAAFEESVKVFEASFPEGDPKLARARAALEAAKKRAPK